MAISRPPQSFYLKYIFGHKELGICGTDPIKMFWGGIEPPHYDFQSYALPFKLPKLNF